MVSPRVTTDTFITDWGSKAGDFFFLRLSAKRYDRSLPGMSILVSDPFSASYTYFYICIYRYSGEYMPSRQFTTSFIINGLAH